MFRPALSYVLVSLILVSQIGLPVHFHYCKGLLESVTLLVNPGCDDHQEVSDLPACCKKVEASHCNSSKDDCCDDQVVVLTQDITSLTPHLLKWTDISFVSDPVPTVITPALPCHQTRQREMNEKDTGPPIYILHRALLFYA